MKRMNRKSHTSTSRTIAPKTAIPRTTVYPCPCPGPCPQTLPQRVAELEVEVADINVTLAQQTAELQNHETRIDNLEQTVYGGGYPPYPPYPPPPPTYPFNDPLYPFRLSNQQQSQQDPFGSDKSLGQPAEQGRDMMVSDSRDVTTTYPPYPYYPPSKKPPIIFDGYSISYQMHSVNGVTAYFWYLIPESSTNTDVYRFSYKSSSNKYWYEPVNPLDYSVVYPASATDGSHITYIYEFITDYGYGLRPYLYLAQDTTPHTALGYQYMQITFTSTTTTNEWCYVPVAEVNPSVSTPYSRNINFTFTKTSVVYSSVTYYNVVDPTAIDPLTDVNKFPTGIVNNGGSTDITSEIVPIGTSVAFLLPFDSNVYQVSFTATLKINTETIPVVPPQSSINYLSGSSYVSAQPAVVQLYVMQMTSTGPSISTTPTASLQFTWSNMCTDPSSVLPAPGNFMVYQETGITGQPGAYYQACPSNIYTVYNIAPVLDTNGNPYGRRLVTLGVTAGFSFSTANMIITRV